ncbi:MULTISPECIES: D-alanine--D-alanine ligase [Fusobacterium]|uniref:D-alanine--D-alanine ligase n=1 Tax=Fusobacterium TaxID=848 RepID=UPI001476A569|nr:MULTISPECIES: D-alanine--D-alanine ligase [Fusobacterium]NME36002.1 D-alanine--D-alanine ligase [Fusobacterium sp. FSA-380-WT-3A]
MRIAVFMGGISSEREISLKTGKAILESLQRQGYDAYGIELNHENLLSAFLENEYDLAYLALHGVYGEDGRIQGLLDILGKKYTGSGMIASAVSMDKNLTKHVAENIGIPVPKSYSKEEIESIEKYPIVVKPSTEGSTIGLYICNNLEELKKAIEFSGDKDITIEDFIKGEELTVGVIEGESLGVIRIKPKNGLYDFTSKYTKGMTEYEFPAKIDEDSYNKAMEYASKIHKALNMRGISRSDFILRENEIFFLEVNSCPGMTETSLVPKVATLKGYSFDDLTRKMVENFK